MPGDDSGHSTLVRQGLDEDSPAPAAPTRAAAETITLQVAFAGHNRALDLGRRPPVLEGLFAAFNLINAASSGPARLLTGLASGADELAAAAWRQAGLGPIHAVFPFLHDPELDLVLLSTEPYRFTEDHADALERQLGKPVLLVDGEMLSWYGSRAMDGVRYLAALAAAN